MHIGKVCAFIAVASALSAAATASDVSEALKQGRQLQSQGRLVEAEQRFETALRGAGERPDQIDSQVTALGNLASVDIDLGLLDKAASRYQDAVAILVKTSGPDGRQITELYLQMAELYLESGQTSTAEKILRNVVPREYRPAMHRDYSSALALDLMACVYAHKKKPDRAEKMERESLSILGELSNGAEAALAIGYMHLATFLESRKIPNEALHYAERSLALLRMLPEPQPAMEAAADITLASILASLSRKGAAETAATAGYKLAERYYGPNNPRTATILLAEAAIMRRIGQKQEARVADWEARRILADNGNGPQIQTVPADALLEHK